MTELNMNLPERALEALGKERSALAAYKKQNAELQKRIRELEKGIRKIKQLADIGQSYWNVGPGYYQEISEVSVAVLKGKE